MFKKIKHQGKHYIWVTVRSADFSEPDKMYRLLACDSKDCCNTAETTLVWTDEWGYFCGPCTNWILFVASPIGLGHGTPRATLRWLEREEVVKTIYEVMAETYPDEAQLSESEEITFDPRVKDVLYRNEIEWGGHFNKHANTE